MTRTGESALVLVPTRAEAEGLSGGSGCPPAGRHSHLVLLAQAWICGRHSAAAVWRLREPPRRRRWPARRAHPVAAHCSSASPVPGSRPSVRWPACWSPPKSIVPAWVRVRGATSWGRANWGCRSCQASINCQTRRGLRRCSII